MSMLDQIELFGFSTFVPIAVVQSFVTNLSCFL